MFCCRSKSDNLAEVTGTSYGSVQTILIRKVSARWILKILTDEQTKKRHFEEESRKVSSGLGKFFVMFREHDKYVAVGWSLKDNYLS